MEILIKYFVIFILITVVATPDLPTSVINYQICLRNEHGFLEYGKSTALLQKVIETEYEKSKTDDEKMQQLVLNVNSVRLMVIYDKYFWEMKPAAKMTEKEQPKSTLFKMSTNNDVEIIPIRVWRHGNELHDTSGFLRFGMRYRNGRLVVPVACTYLLYSFIDLFEPCDPSNGKPNVKNFENPILEEEELQVVSSVQPHTASRNEYLNSYSSYVSILAELKAGDELSVKVSNITYLKCTRNNSFCVSLF